jgi:hypothetical protein
MKRFFKNIIRKIAEQIVIMLGYRNMISPSVEVVHSELHFATLRAHHIVPVQQLIALNPGEIADDAKEHLRHLLFMEVSKFIKIDMEERPDQSIQYNAEIIVGLKKRGGGRRMDWHKRFIESRECAFKKWIAKHPEGVTKANLSSLKKAIKKADRELERREGHEGSRGSKKAI